MAARVTASEVKEIMDNCTLSDTIVDVYITGANALVTAILGDDTTISSTLLMEVERWYAAHMIASTTHRSAVSEKLGDASVKYADTFREGLMSTPYGQMVLQLDTTGKMGAVGMRRATIRAVDSFDD
jgi:hypothetical protein